MKIRPMIFAVSAIAFGLAGGIAAQAQDHPMASNHAAHNDAVKSPDRMHAPLARGRNSFTMGEATSRFHKAGYTHVSHVMLDRNGLWQARAMRHGRWVNVALDYKGNVSAR